MQKSTFQKGALLCCPCLFCPSDNVWRSHRDNAPWWTHFSTVISPSWITEQISVGKCVHRGASARRERQTSFKIVTYTKQTWTNHHDTSKKGTFSWKREGMDIPSILAGSLPLVLIINIILIHWGGRGGGFRGVSETGATPLLPPPLIRIPINPYWLPADKYTWFALQ